MLLTPSEATTPDVWGRTRVYPQSSGIPGPRDPGITPYMIPFGVAATAGKYKRVVAVVGAQMGKTETMLDIIGQRLDQRPAPVLYVGPSKEFLTDQFEPRLMGLLDQSKSLSRKVVRGRRMKKTRKVISGVPLRLAHAGSSTALKSDPAALALVDEYDEMLANIRGQGDPLGLVEARGDTHADFVTVIASTPSQGTVETEVDAETGLEFWKVGDPEAIQSPTWKLFQEGTRFHYAWPCPQCGGYFVPMRKHLRWPDRSTPAQARRGAYLCCPVSGCWIIDDPDGKTKAGMNARGVMVAPGQRIDDDGNVSGDPPDSSTYSQWVSGLASPFVSWGESAERMLKAELAGEEDKIQTAANARFGECYALGGGGEAPEWEDVKAKALPYEPGDVPQGVLRVVAAIDVQKRSLIYVVRGYGARGASWLLDRGVIFGPTDQDDVWDDLWSLLQTTYDGLPIEKAFIDSGFRPDKPDAGDEHRVYAFCRQYSWVAFATKGRAVMAGSTIRASQVDFKDKRGRTHALSLFLINSDHFKSVVHSKVRTPIGRPGSFYLPSDIDEDYCRQIVSEARTVVEGKPVWVRKNRNNHFLDCEALAEAAASTLLPRVNLIPEGVVRGGGYVVEEQAEIESPDDGAPEKVAPLAVAAPPPGAQSFRDRFSRVSGRFNR